MSGNTIEKIPLTKMHRKKNIRTQIDDLAIEGLAQSLQSVGQLVPIRVRSVDDLFEITDGGRRYLAAQKLSWTTLDAIVERQDVGEGEVLSIQLIANCQRAELSALDKARAIEQLMRSTGWNASETATKLGMSGSGITRYLSLLTLPSEFQREIELGHVSAATAYEITKVADPAKQASLIEIATEKRLTRDAAVGQIKKSRLPEPKESKGGTRKATLIVDGSSTISVSTSDLTIDRLATLLEETLARVRKARQQGWVLDTLVRALKDQARELR
ncbi:ParB/RepB/Spo0J family partition protein [bacterium]|nr:ParB/RepB/Spo0J family partition protein [bacterium]